MKTLIRVTTIVVATVSLMMLIDDPSIIVDSTENTGGTASAFLSEHSLQNLESAAGEIVSALRGQPKDNSLQGLPSGTNLLVQKSMPCGLPINGW